MMTSPLLTAAPAVATEEGGHNILKGTSLALIHPIVMVTLFTLSIYAGYLGLQVLCLRNRVKHTHSQTVVVSYIAFEARLSVHDFAMCRAQHTPRKSAGRAAPCHGVDTFAA